ncbi:MAG TPA: hypothetical protein VE974_26800 [Thermoanaerobaculia bacterium]|nr:hypothetical protein [Thermoanaerobaculia bacterium]
MEMIPIIGMLSSSATVVLIVYFVTKARQRRVEVQVEMQSRLIDRFGSAPELVEFLHSPAGRTFVTGVQGAPAALTRERLMSGFSRAIVLTMLGAGFLFLTFYSDDDWVVPAAILFFLGIGYLIATYVSYKLSAKLMGDTASEP